MTEDRRTLYARQGYVTVRQLLSPDELLALQRQTEGAIHNKAQPIQFDQVGEEARAAVPDSFKDSEGRIFRRLDRAIDRGGAYEAVACGTLARAVAQILQGPIYVCLNRHNMVMLKAPFNPAPVQWHQDAAVWNEGTFEHLSAIVAIDDFRLDSGCLEVVPGSHQWGPLGLGWEENITAIIQGYQERIAHEAVPVDLKAGDAVLFHGLLLHGSPGNQSAYARRSLTICYYPGDLSRISTRREAGNTSGHRPILRQVIP